MRLAALSASLLALSAAAAPDPLKDFQATVLQRCQAAMAARPTDSVRQLPKGDWVHRFSTPVQVQYDVKKTDSLVSPYTAVVKLNWTEQNVRASTEEEARAATAEGALATIMGKYEIRYAYQAAKWTLTGGKVDMPMKMKGEFEFRSSIPPVESSPDDLRSAVWIRDCLR